MLEIGDQAPEFSARDDQDNEVSLSGLLQSGPLILYFYPADFTPVCTAEACGIRDLHEDLSGIDIQVVGVSPQNSSSHQRFKERYELPFRLICDVQKSLIKLYGCNGPLGMGVRRATYLINQEGIIEDRVVSDLFAGSHISFIKQILEQQAS